MYYRRVPGIFSLPHIVLEAKMVVLLPRTALDCSFHWRTLVASHTQPGDWLNFLVTQLHRHQTSATTFDLCQDGVDQSLIEGHQQTLRYTDKYLFGFFPAFFVFAADFCREWKMQNNSTLRVNFEQRTHAGKPAYCFVQVTQQLLSSLNWACSNRFTLFKCPNMFARTHSQIFNQVSSLTTGRQLSSRKLMMWGNSATDLSRSAPWLSQRTPVYNRMSLCSASNTAKWFCNCQWFNARPQMRFTIPRTVFIVSCRPQPTLKKLIIRSFG